MPAVRLRPAVASLAIAAAVAAPCTSGEAQSLAGVRVAAVAARIPDAADSARRDPVYQVGDRAFVGSLIGMTIGTVAGASALCARYPRDNEGYCTMEGGAIGMWFGFWSGAAVGAINGLAARGCERPNVVVRRAVGRAAAIALGGAAASVAIQRATPTEQDGIDIAVGTAGWVGGAVTAAVVATRTVNRCG
jgi:hypothetical protein